MNFQLTLTGTRPLLMHNGRLANPLDPYTRALKQITSRTKKTDEDLLEQVHMEARGSAWETEDGSLALNAEAVWRAIFDQAKSYKLGKKVEGSLELDCDEYVPILINGAPVFVDDHLAVDGHIDVRMAKVSGRKITRARCRVPSGWTATVGFELDEAQLDFRSLSPIIEEIGDRKGVGDWRPRHGRFATEVTHV